MLASLSGDVSRPGSAEQSLGLRTEQEKLCAWQRRGGRQRKEHRGVESL